MFVSFFPNGWRAVLLSWVKIGGMDKGGRGMRSHRFFYPGAGGVECVPWTLGPQFSLCEIRHFWIFFQHLWRVNAGNKSAKMVIGPTSMFGLFQSCGGSNAMEDPREGLAKLRSVSDCDPIRSINRSSSIGYTDSVNSLRISIYNPIFLIIKHPLEARV